LLKRRGTQFVVVSSAEPDALREASFFVDRLSEERMPLAGLILNRTHPMLCSLPVERAIDGAKTLESEPEGTDGTKALAMAVLQIHADRASTSKREIRLLSRFTGANPHVAIVGVPSLPFDVSDLEALRAIADQMTAVGDDAG
jgi:anion-transporting  ArsA/GET3 family ATPase